MNGDAVVGGGGPEQTDARAFGRIVRALRLGAGRSLKSVATAAGIDAAYLFRVERGAGGAPVVPRRAVALAIGQALGLSGAELDDLLVRAGYAPESVLRLGGWDSTLAAVTSVLLDPGVAEEARAAFREFVEVAARHWARAPRES